MLLTLGGLRASDCLKIYTGALSNAKGLFLLLQIRDFTSSAFVMFPSLETGR